ncbi:Ubiquitin-conjugating enzyme/RWD-like [Phytophthora cactorum]|nr:Ubiquitin-conjugating enzyme/RWD-like [Phytophthora cactorum]
MSTAARRRLMRDFRKLQNDPPSGVSVYNDGQICLDILQNQWSPIYDISAILTSIHRCCVIPTRTRQPTRRRRLFQENRREYNRRVREIVEQSWQAIA